MDIDVCGMVCVINGKNGPDSKLDVRNGLTCKPAASGEFGTPPDAGIWETENIGVVLEVVAIAILPEVAVSVLIVVMGVTVGDVVDAETRAAKVGAVSDVTKMGCANFGNDAI